MGCFSGFSNIDAWSCYKNRQYIDAQNWCLLFCAKEIHLSHSKLSISDKHSMNRHLASHVTCPHCKSFLLFVHIERSHGEPSSMVPVHRRPVGAGAATKKKHAAVGYRRVPREGRMWWVFSICWKLHLTFPSGKAQEIHFFRKFSHKDLKYYHLPWFIARRGKQVEKKRGPFSRLAHSCSLHSADETTNWTRSWWCTCARLQKLL